VTKDTTARERIKLRCLVTDTRKTELAVKVGASKQDIARVGVVRYRTGKLVDAVTNALGCAVEWLVALV
jgi:hypothetical protein